MGKEEKRIRVITDDGAFGVPGYMVIVRLWLPKEQQTDKIKSTVTSYVIVEGTDEEQLARAEKFRKDSIVLPNFAAFTLLKFISETRELAEPEVTEAEEGKKIIIPTNIMKKRALNGNGSKYLPDGT